MQRPRVEIALDPRLRGNEETHPESLQSIFSTASDGRGSWVGGEFRPARCPTRTGQLNAIVLHRQNLADVAEDDEVSVVWCDIHGCRDTGLC